MASTFVRIFFCSCFLFLGMIKSGFAITPDELVSKYQDKHFVEKKYGFNDSIVRFAKNPMTGRPNLVFLSKDRGKFQYYEYIYDMETWFDFVINETDKGIEIVCTKDGINQVYRWSYPWEKDVHQHPEKYAIRKKVLAESSDDGSYGRVNPDYPGETKVAALTPYVTTFLIQPDETTLIVSPTAPYPSACQMQNSSFEWK